MTATALNQMVLSANHELLRSPIARCAACTQFLKSGDTIALVPLGPGPDPEARAAAREQRSYNAVALPVHWACATGETA